MALENQNKAAEKCKWCGKPIRLVMGGAWVHDSTSKNWCHKKHPIRGQAEFHAVPDGRSR
jgi:hypothetical protein